MQTVIALARKGVSERPGRSTVELILASTTSRQRRRWGTAARRGSLRDALERFVYWWRHSDDPLAY